jgi:hypothetical protein
MTVTQASLDALAAHTRKRRDTVSHRVEKALRDLRRQNATITISSVSRRAGSPAKASTAATTWWPASARIARSRPSPTTQRRRRQTKKAASSPRYGPD